MDPSLNLFFTARKRSLGQGNIFTPVCYSVHRGGACVVAPGGRGVCGCSAGCMCGCSGGHAWLLRGGGGHAWLLQGGHAWLLQGGMCGCSGGAHVVAPGGHAWLLQEGHAWDTTRYGDTINERAVRILLECILVFVI